MLVNKLDLVLALRKIQNPPENHEVKYEIEESTDSETKGKFSVWIQLHYGSYYEVLAHSEDRFSSKEEAQLWAEKFIKAIRDMESIPLSKDIPEAVLDLLK